MGGMGGMGGKWGKMGRKHWKNGGNWEKIWRLGKNWGASQLIPNPCVGRGIFHPLEGGLSPFFHSVLQKRHILTHFPPFSHIFPVSEQCSSKVTTGTVVGISGPCQHQMACWPCILAYSRIPPRTQKGMHSLGGVAKQKGVEGIAERCLSKDRKRETTITHCSAAFDQTSLITWMVSWTFAACVAFVAWCGGLQHLVRYSREIPCTSRVGTPQLPAESLECETMEKAHPKSVQPLGMHTDLDNSPPDLTHGKLQSPWAAAALDQAFEPRTLDS